jgi:hypothetical protein
LGILTETTKLEASGRKWEWKKILLVALPSTPGRESLVSCSSFGRGPRWGKSALMDKAGYLVRAVPAVTVPAVTELRPGAKGRSILVPYLLRRV